MLLNRCYKHRQIDDIIGYQRLKWTRFACTSQLINSNGVDKETDSGKSSRKTLLEYLRGGLHEHRLRISKGLVL